MKIKLVRGLAWMLGGMVACAGCSVNILSGFANHSTNEALFEDAQADLNNDDYTGALEKIGAMTGDYPAQTVVVQLKAAAFAGLCGFKFFPFVKAMGNMGSQRLFPFLLATFDAASGSNIDYCVSAQNTLLALGGLTSRTDDQNLFIALTAFAKVGNVLSYYADAGKTGAALAGFDACAVGGPPRPAAGGAMADADARELGVSLALAITNLQAVSSSVNLGSGSLATLNGVCAALPASYDFCGVSDPAAFTANQVKGIRSFIKESSVVGLGANCTGDVSACNCP